MWHKVRGKKLPTTLTPDEVGQMINRAENIRDKMLMIFLYYTGFRVSEASHCKVGDVSLEEGTIKVREGKGSKDRIIAIHATLNRALTQWIGYDNTPDNYLFPGQKDRPLHPRQIYRIVKDTAKRAGISKNVHPHTFRHSIALHLRRSGKDLITISRFLGHEDVSTTQIYADADVTDIQKMMGGFE